jgi:hypothetical protein
MAQGANEKLKNERGETALALVGTAQNPLEKIRFFLSKPEATRPVGR